MSETIARDPRMAQDFGARMSLIIWWPIVEIVSEVDPRLTQLIRREGEVYPDGSASIGTTIGIRDVWTLLDEYGKGGFDFRYNTIFRSVAGYSPREYQLLTTVDYFQRIGGEQDFLVAPVRFCDNVTVGERTLDRLSVNVRFYRRPDRPALAQFESSVVNWAETLDDERFGRVRFIRDSCASRGKTCTFEIDARLGTQEALNWLALAVLNFGAKTWPVAGVGFGHRI